MKSIFLTIIFLAFDMTVETEKEKSASSSSKIGHRIAKTSTNHVVNHEFCLACLSEDEKKWKENLKDVHTYAELKEDHRADLPSSFTICSSVMTTYGSKQILFNVLGNDGNSWLESFLTVDDKTSFMFWKSADVRLAPVFAHQWVRSCMAVNSETGFLQWVVDGTLVESNTIDRVRDTRNKPTNLTGKVVFGVWQSPGSKKWDSIWSNQVTNLNIFSTELTIKEMQQNTNGGRCAREGDYLAWKEMRWNLKGQAVIETVDEEEICNGGPSLNFFNAQFFPMESCMHFCQKLGSRSPPLVTKLQWTKLLKDLERLINNRDPKEIRIWLALNDIDTEEEWADFYDLKVANFSLPWVPGEPNGGETENCAALELPGNLYDFPCDNPNWPSACICERTPSQYLRLWGLCSNSAVQDTLYQPRNNLTDFTKLALVGFRTLIEYDNKEMVWVMTDAESNVTGTSRAPLESFTLGKHNWTIRGDRGCSKNNGEAEYTTELKMSGCQEGEFTCNDGQCVSSEQRCNQLPDCRDESDEKNCKVLVLKDGYNKNVPPVTSGVKKVNVSISLDILNLVDIKEEDYSVEIQFSITLKWKENRATYHNLKHEKTLNALTSQEIGELWLPEVIYENTDQKETTRLGEFGNGEWKTRVVVNRQGNFTRSKLDVVDEIEIFKGFENSLIMSQTYTHDFQCSYDFSMYPFDTQV